MKLSRHEDITLIRLDRKLFGMLSMSSYCYFIDGLLVDTGYSKGRKNFIGAVGNLKIHTCVITHFHEDHSGNGDWIKMRTGKAPLAHAETCPYLEAGFPLLPYRRLFWGRPALYSTDPIGDFIETDRFHFDIIDLSGHAPGMIGLHEPGQGWLFSSDLCVLEKPRHFMIEEDFAGVLSSLKRALELDFDTLLCSHNPRLRSGKRAVQQKYDYLVDLRDKVSDLAGRGLNVTQIRSNLLGREDFQSLFSFGEYSKQNLVRSIVASLRNEM